jgi:phosphate transport system substrate-binding protein
MTIGAKGNAGVATQVKTIPNTIGYVEYAYAKQNKLITIKMINSAGKTIAASLDSFNEAAKNAKWDASNGFNLVLTDAPGDNSWPIAATTFVLMYKDSLTTDSGKAIIQFFTWAFEHGKDNAKALDYVPMPDSVIAMIKDSWK